MGRLAIIGRHEPDYLDADLLESIKEKVIKGTILIVLESADFYAEMVQTKLKVRPPYY